jgi:acetyltransferase-like isoleucine patch superfamily enzyme
MPRRLATSAIEWLLGRPLAMPPEDPVAAGHLTVGEHSYGWPQVNVYPGDTGKVRIGRFTATAADVEVFVGGNNRTDWVSSYPFRIMFDLPGALQDGAPSSRGDVEIGHDVWIGKGSKILSGVRVGNGAVIGAYSVVPRDVRPYAIVVGNPAVEVRRRFTDEQIDMLQRIAWWDWPLQQILEAVPMLSTDNVGAFIDRWGPAVGS